MVANDLSFPPYNPEVPHSDEMTAINVVGDNYKNQRLEAHSATSCSPSEDSSTAQQSHKHYPQQLTQIGINFILALEQPCLSHRNHVPEDLIITDSIGAAGHEAMLTSPITAHGPESTQVDTYFDEYPPGTQWTVPTAQLEGLLRSSQSLGLSTEEVTPVQAWHIIMQHDRFESLMFESLERLRCVLMPMVVCYGYVMIHSLSTHVADKLPSVLVPLSNELDSKKL
jgi:hypothetical protein